MKIYRRGYLRKYILAKLLPARVLLIGGLVGMVLPLVAPVAYAETPTPSAGNSQSSGIASMPVVYTLPGMDRVQVQAGIVYKIVDGEDLKLDVYSPPDQKVGETLPAVILIGPLADQRKDGQYTSWSRLLSASGLLAITFSHRSGFATGDMRIAEDIDDLIEYIRVNATLLGVDPNRLGTWSPSTGVPYSVRTSFLGQPEYIRAAAFYYGPLNDAEESAQPNEFSALDYLVSGQSMPPIFIAKAGKDRASINETLDHFVAEAGRRGTHVILSVHENGQHAFDLLDNDRRSREIVAGTLEFFTQVLLKGELPSQAVPPTTVPDPLPGTPGSEGTIVPSAGEKESSSGGPLPGDKGAPTGVGLPPTGIGWIKQATDIAEQAIGFALIAIGVAFVISGRRLKNGNSKSS